MQNKHNIMSKEFQIQVSDPEAIKKLNQISKRIDLMEKRLPQPLSKLIDRKQLSQLLCVSIVTIIDWDKKGILNPLRIGNRVRYKLSEIERILENSTNQKSET